jgi:hypothetical protein
MLFLPPEGGNLAVQDLDGPPLGHNRDRTSALANRNTCLPGRSRYPALQSIATARRCGRFPGDRRDDHLGADEPTASPRNVIPKATRELSAAPSTRPTAFLPNPCAVSARWIILRAVWFSCVWLAGAVAYS